VTVTSIYNLELVATVGTACSIEPIADEPVGWGLQPPPSVRQSHHSFGQTLFFSSRSQQPNMKKVFIERQKTEFIPTSKMKCPKSGIFVNNNYWVGLVDPKSNFAG